MAEKNGDVSATDKHGLPRTMAEKNGDVPATDKHGLTHK